MFRLIPRRLRASQFLFVPLHSNMFRLILIKAFLAPSKTINPLHSNMFRLIHPGQKCIDYGFLSLHSNMFRLIHIYAVDDTGYIVYLYIPICLD